ncbi:hypothetical protein LguiB_034466 [Lonicera macranthoides]
MPKIHPPSAGKLPSHGSKPRPHSALNTGTSLCPLSTLSRHASTPMAYYHPAHSRHEQHPRPLAFCRALRSQTYLELL